MEILGFTLLDTTYIQPLDYQMHLHGILNENQNRYKIDTKIYIIDK